MTNVISEVFGIPSTTGLLNEHSDRLITDDRVGVEVELEDLISQSLLRGMTDPRWRVIEDGSLRSMGAEFVFKEPMFGVDVIETLCSLEPMFNRVGIAPTTGERTSVHVHLDVRDLSYSQLLNLILVYLLCEPYFFAVGGEERRNSPYSFPLAETDDYLHRIGMAMRSANSSTFTTHINTNAKYSAFNIAPVSTQGSVEFRHHRGTYKPEALIRWVNMVLCIKRYTLSLGTTVMTPEFIDGLINGGFDNFIDDVFDGVDVPRGVDGWDSAARVAKRVSQRAGGTDDNPVLPSGEHNDGNHFTDTQAEVAEGYELDDPSYFIAVIRDALGRQSELDPTYGFSTGDLNRILSSEAVRTMRTPHHIDFGVDDEDYPEEDE